MMLPQRDKWYSHRPFAGNYPISPPSFSMAELIFTFAALVSVVAGQSGGIQRGLQYGENWAPTTKDSDLVSANFPDVNITLRSPAFLNPEKVPARFSNGTEGPTDDIELGETANPDASRTLAN
jgi:hypothetical protein